MINNIFKKLQTTSGKLSGAKLKVFVKSDEYDFVLENTKWMSDDTTPLNRIYCLLNDINKHPECICGNLLKFKGYSVGYIKYCSVKCGIVGSNRAERTKKTLLEKYGSETYNNRDKQKKTNLERYGVESTNSLPEIKEKQRNSKIEIYGESPDKWIFNNITKFVFKEKYGECNIPNSHMDYSELSRRLSPNSYKFLDDKDWCEKAYKDKTTIQISQELDVAHSTVTNYLIKHDIPRNNWNSISGEENSVLLYIKSIYDGIIIENSRSIISPYELDIFIPEFNLAIEYDGIFWHNSDRVGKDYHTKKTSMCLDIGIELLHIFSNEWINNCEIWKSVILNKLKQSKKIYARKCKIKLVTKNDAIQFFDNNHLQGSINRGNFYGLYFNDILVACINYGKSRYGKFEWEIYRYCNLLGTTVVGGFSKLLKKIPVEGTVVSYANARWSVGNLYKSCGFEYSHTTRPNYFYVKSGKLYSREKFQKHKLIKLLNIFDENLTESENMKNNGYDVIHDCGNLVYHITK